MKVWEKNKKEGTGLKMENKIIANVGGNPIYQTEVDEVVTAYAARGQNFDSEQGRAMILDQLIGKKLLVLDAKKNLMEHNAEFKAELEKMKNEMLANFNISKVLAKVEVKDEELKEYYEENKAQFVRGETVAASHILVDSEDKAKEIMESIEKGEVSFEDAARSNSSCPSGQNGGALGEFTKGQMVPEFDSAVFSMEVGEMRGPVKTQFGFHIIKLTAKNEASEMAFDEVKERLANAMLQEKRQQAYDSKINQLKILFPVDKF